MNNIKELSELISGVRNSLDDTDNLALGLKSGTWTEEQFMENYKSIVQDIERAENILDSMLGQ